MIFDRSKSLNGGAILHRDWAVDSWYWHTYAGSGRFDIDKPLRDYTDAEWKLLLLRGRREGRDRARPQVDEGRLRGRRDQVQPALHRGRRGGRAGKQETVATYTTSVRCPACGGTRLAEAPRTARWTGTRCPRSPRSTLGSTATPCSPTLRTRRGRAARGRGPHPRRRPGRHGAGLPHPRPGDLHALGRGVAADQDGAPPRVRRWSTSCTCSTSRRSGCTRATSAG